MRLRKLEFAILNEAVEEGLVGKVTSEQRT